MTTSTTERCVRDRPSQPGGWPADDGGERELRSRLLLRSLPGIGDRLTARLVREHGSGVRAARALRSAERRRQVPRVPTAADWQRAEETCEAAWRRTRDCGASLLAPGLPGYPSRLQDLADAPALLWCRGETACLGGPTVAIVGARRASPYGRRLARALAAATVRAGGVVVSGMALGIDGEAHAAALSVGGTSVAVLGSGVDVPSPASHAALYRALVADGAVLSEFFPGEGARPEHFPRRNRIIAALADAVVVVEAGLQSGSLITVEHALDLGRSVFALPGPVDRAVSAGSNALIRDGAAVITSVEAFVRDLVEMVGWMPAGRPGGSRPDPEFGAASPVGIEAAVLAALEEGETGVDALVDRTGSPVAEVLSALTRLQVDGWVEVRAGQRYARSSNPDLPR